VPGVHEVAPGDIDALRTALQQAVRLT